MNQIVVDIYKREFNIDLTQIELIDRGDSIEVVRGNSSNLVDKNYLSEPITLLALYKHIDGIENAYRNFERVFRFQYCLDLLKTNLIYIEGFE